MARGEGEADQELEDLHRREGSLHAFRDIDPNGGKGVVGVLQKDISFE